MLLKLRIDIVLLLLVLLGRLFALRVGQKVAVVPFGDKIIVQPLPEKPEEELAKLTREIVFDREARKKASKSLISQAKR